MQKSDDEIPFLIHHDDLIVEAYLLKWQTRLLSAHVHKSKSFIVWRSVNAYEVGNINLQTKNFNGTLLFGCEDAQTNTILNLPVVKKENCRPYLQNTFLTSWRRNCGLRLERWGGLRGKRR
jgi:hypothetical protein